MVASDEIVFHKPQEHLHIFGGRHGSQAHSHHAVWFLPVQITCLVAAKAMGVRILDVVIFQTEGRRHTGWIAETASADIDFVLQCCFADIGAANPGTIAVSDIEHDGAALATGLAVRRSRVLVDMDQRHTVLMPKRHKPMK